MNKIIAELLGEGIIRFENALYRINDGYFIMVKDKLLLISAIFIDDYDRLFVCYNTLQSYPVNHIDDLTIIKLI